MLSSKRQRSGDWKPRIRISARLEGLCRKPTWWLDAERAEALNLLLRELHLDVSHWPEGRLPSLTLVRATTFGCWSAPPSTSILPAAPLTSSSLSQ